MKKEIVIFTAAALIFVTPVAANNNHNQNNNKDNHGFSIGRFGGRLADNHRGDDNKHHQNPSSTPSATPVATPPITSQENNPPSNGGFDCGKLIGRVFSHLNFFHHR